MKKPDLKKEKEINRKIQSILKENGYKMDYQISFPQYNIYPDEVKLALSIIIKHGMRIQIVLKELVAST